MCGYIRYSETAVYRLLSNVGDAVREGRDGGEQTLGGKGGVLYNFFKTEGWKGAFLAGMNGFGMLSSPAVVRAFDLSAFRRLVDLGGATGHLPIAACEAYPELHAVVFDLPEVIPVTEEYIARSSAAGRLQTVAGDFFTGELPPADIYALGRILHDWGLERIELLLRKIHARLPRGGALLIAEKILDAAKSGPVHVQTQSLNILLCTEGKERTLGEYKAVLEAPRVTDVQRQRTGAPVHAILA